MDKKYDALKREISVGDFVVRAPYGGYASINFALVVKLTAKQVTVAALGRDMAPIRRYSSRELDLASVAPGALLIINEMIEKRPELMENINRRDLLIELGVL